MKKYGLFFMCICFLSTLSAQSGKNITLNVRTGDDVNVLLSSDKFLFSDYQEALFYTKMGPGRAKMNYNMLTGEMMFINSSGDTLALSNPRDIQSLRLGKQEFIYKSPNYLEILCETDNKALLLLRRIKPSVVKQSGGYGVKSASASIKNVSAITDEQAYSDNRLGVSSEVSYEVTYTFYLRSGRSFYTGATEKNFVRAFGKAKKDLISQYIQDNALDLKNETHLIQLFNFCAE